MIWSTQQEQAIDAVGRWLASPTEQVFYLAGYAGTGKTTITKHLTEGLDGRVAFAAYTGKAAHVMQRSGCVGATTIHRLIYQPKERSRARLKELEQWLLACAEAGVADESLAETRAEIEAERKHIAAPAFTLNPQSEANMAKLIVIDECSMVGSDIGRDLLSFKKPVLVIGDPAQLPPVKSTGFFTTRRPDVFLTEIHRQAHDNPIIALATEVREGNALKYGTYGDSEILSYDDEDAETRSRRVRAADMLLVGLRKTRALYNDRMRAIAGHEGELPHVGEKIICLRNSHQTGFLNGSLWRVDDVGDYDEHEQQVYLTVSSLDDPDAPATKECWAYVAPFSTGEAIWQRDDDCENFTHGAAITVHKAQGSEYDDVVLFDESGSFRENSSRWLYTGITRAAKRITIVR
jgi:exodeoxyribonuclease-5